jgi:hypothetical protein
MLCFPLTQKPTINKEMLLCRSEIPVASCSLSKALSKAAINQCSGHMAAPQRVPYLDHLERTHRPYSAATFARCSGGPSKLVSSTHFQMLHKLERILAKEKWMIESG